MNREWLHTMDSEGITPLGRAFQSGHMAIAELLLRKERRECLDSTPQTSPLHRAADLGLSQAVKSLLRYGADPGLVDEQGETPLHKAIRCGQYETIELLARESDVNAQDNEGMTPLHYACMAGNDRVVRLLLANGADPWVRNEIIDGLTPVDVAHSMGYQKLAHLLSAGEVLV